MVTATEHCPKCKREHAARHLRAHGGTCGICAGAFKHDPVKDAAITARGLVDTALRIDILRFLTITGAITGPAGVCPPMAPHAGTPAVPFAVP